MELDRFDHLTRWLAGARSRRGLAGGLGLAALAFPGLAAAKKRKGKKRKRNKKQKVTFNTFGCVNVGSFCQRSDQCCSGICEGSPDKKTCRPHDQSTCQPGQDDYCTGGPPLPCTTTANYSGACVSTTGNASYCEYNAHCHECNKDADCVPFCGPRSACIVADACCPSIGTACATVDNAGCTFP